MNAHVAEMKINLKELYTSESPELKQYLKPTISIEYRTDHCGLLSGDFDNIPENAYSARISQKLPFIDGNGNISFIRFHYNTYVGYKLEQNGVLGVVTDGEFRKLDPEDKIFTTFDEMKQAITSMAIAFGYITSSYQPESLDKEENFSK